VRKLGNLGGFPGIPGLEGKTTDKKEEKKEKPKEGSDRSTVTLEDLAAEHDITPAAARAFLRSAIENLLEDE